MAKTFTSSLPSVSTGDVLTASNYNNAITTLNNHTVPPTCQVRRTTQLNSYTSDAAITWESTGWDTDSMYSAGTPTRITIATAGLYLVNFYAKASGTGTITLINGSISVNGAVALGNYVNVISGVTAYFATTAVLSLAVSDYITCAAGYAGGSAYYVEAGARCTATWIGKTA